MIRANWGPWEVPPWARGRRADMVMHHDSMYCAVRVVGDDHPQLAARQRMVIGTGFLVNVRSELHDGYYPHIVTAAHVIEGQQKVEIEVPIPRATGGMYAPVVVSSWHRPLPHVDLAVALFEDTGEHKALYGIDEEEIMPNRWVQKLSLAGDVAYVGILTPLDRPMVRTGTIGAIDQAGIKFAGSYDYTAHLIDCRSYGGFSGSPVFAGIAKPGLTATAEYEGTPLGEMAYFGWVCGMFTEHLTDANSYASSRYGVGVMVRSIEIREALMAKELQDERRERDERIRDAEPREPKLRPARSENESEFSRFEDLTRKLVNTPKSEIDEKRKTSQ